MNPYWPLFDLRVRTPRLELRLPTDEDLVALAEAAATGVHEAEWMPFTNAWTAADPPTLQRNVIQYHWRTRGEWTPQKWAAGFVVVHEGAVVGTQGVEATEFARLRRVDTGSWLARAHQGRGLGKEMRAAVLHLAFAGLGAAVATTAARADNAASLGVTTALGYEPNGVQPMLFGDEVAEEHLYRMSRQRWEDRLEGRYETTVEGLEPCLFLFGATH